MRDFVVGLSRRVEWRGGFFLYLGPGVSIRFRNISLTIFSVLCYNKDQIILSADPPSKSVPTRPAGHLDNQGSINMVNPPYGYGPSPFYLFQRTKYELKRTSNQLCWVSLAAIFAMSALTYACLRIIAATGYPLDPAYMEFGGLNPVLYYFAVGIGYVLGLAVPALLFFAAKRIPLSEGLPFRKAGVLKTAACVFFGSAVCMLANIPADMVVRVEQFFGFSGNMPSMPLTDDPLVLVLYGIVIVLIPPLVEEMLFRGMILQSLRRYGNGFAVIASALLFGFYHANFAQSVFAFLCGLAMGFVVIRTGSLLPSILIHMLNNAVSLCLEMVQRYQGGQAAAGLNNAVMGVLLALGAVSVLFLAVRYKGFFRAGPSDPFFRLSSKMGALFANPGGVAMLVYALGMSVYALGAL